MQFQKIQKMAKKDRTFRRNSRVRHPNKGMLLPKLGSSSKLNKFFLGELRKIIGGFSSVGIFQRLCRGTSGQDRLFAIKRNIRMRIHTPEKVKLASLLELSEIDYY